MKRNSDLDGVGCFGLIVFTLLAVVVGTIANGWALSTLWGWFIVPLFGLPALSIPYALGISTIAGFLLPANNTSKSDNKSNGDKELSTLFAELIALVVLRPAFAVLMGWIILQFV